MEIQNMNSMTGPAAELPPSIPGRIEGPHAVGSRLAPVPAGPPVPSTTPDPIGMLKTFQRRWRLALGLGLVGAPIAASVAWYVDPLPKYTAAAVILVEPEQPRLITPTREYRLNPETDRSTQVTPIKSPIVLRKALGQPGVAQLEILRRQPEPAAWLEREIKAEFKGKILRLSLTGENPTEVATLVKSVTRAYLSEVADKEKAQRLERNEILKRHYGQASQAVRGAAKSTQKPGRGGGIERQANLELATTAGDHSPGHGRVGTAANPSGLEARHRRAQGSEHSFGRLS
jgi:uncharacterized protein involved in exopolysaccharide biosynthesis